VSDIPVQGSSLNVRGDPIPTHSTVPTGVAESQTQDETQFAMPRHAAEDLKRKSTGGSTEVQSIKKKIKISMGPAVDLQD
jgi:meiosis-specific protein HOP1